MTPKALVTGASSGIGEAYARRLASEGYDLVVVARRPGRLDVLREELRATCASEVTPLVADLASSEGVDRVREMIDETSPDLLVNNAGLAHYMAFRELPSEDAQELVALNALAPVMLSRAAVTVMCSRGSGSIVNVASLLAFSGSLDAPHLPGRAVYAATKAFLVTFSQVLAAEVREFGVKVQVVCPGVVRSEFHSRQGMDMSSVPRMEPDLVAQASLQDLARGVLVSVPGLDDPAALTRLEESSRALLGAARATELPDRYG